MTDLLIVFAKNPELGKVKTRLARTLGNERALEVYKKLLHYTAVQVNQLDCDIQVHFSGDIPESDSFKNDRLVRIQQIEGNLGQKMMHAFNQNFEKGYKRILIIGSDCAEITLNDLQHAFQKLISFDVVIGPAKDGGYYLLGLTKPFDTLFKNKEWSTSSVFSETLQDVIQSGNRICVLDRKSDIDTVDDLIQFPQFNI